MLVSHNPDRFPFDWLPSKEHFYPRTPAHEIESLVALLVPVAWSAPCLTMALV